MEQGEPWDLLKEGHWFPWHFKVMVASPVLGESMEFQVPVCTRQWDLSPGKGAWSNTVTSGAGNCRLFFSFFLWLVYLFADSERALLLTGYGTLWLPFGVL
jgi:hypothetical protein